MENHCLLILIDADAFNRYFISQCNLVNSSQELPPFHYITGSKLLKIEVSEADVLDELNSLRINKATGPDGVGNVVLKRTAISLYKPLTRLFNYSLHSGIFPSTWKLAHVCPVFKKGDNTLCLNYRPISLLSNVSKLLEKIIHDKIYKYLTNNALLIPNNSGFKHGDSTVNQLLCLSDIILKSLRQR